jgi:hypothetical protein
MERLMTVLDDFQFDLDGFLFGKGLPVIVDEEGFDPGDPDKIVQDGVNPITGTRMFGRDMQGASTWTFACGVDESDVETALEGAAAMGSKWRDEKWLEPEAIAALRYCIAGRTRVVFGRPRRFSFKPNNRILNGYIPPVATFDLVDTKHYDDVEQFVDLQLTPPSLGGFAVPFEAPLAIELPPGSTIQGSMTVGGDTSTAVSVTFYGPLRDGVVKIGSSVEIGFTGVLSATQTITVDARPWALSVKRTGGTAAPLSRKTRLNNCKLPKGSYQATLSGSDETGTGRARVRWRNAHSTL